MIFIHFTDQNLPKKYKKGKNNRETLRCWTELRVDLRLKKIAFDRHDLKLVSVTSGELVLKKHNITLVAIRHTPNQKSHLRDKTIH